VKTTNNKSNIKIVYREILCYTPVSLNTNAVRISIRNAFVSFVLRSNCIRTIRVNSAGRHECFRHDQNIRTAFVLEKIRMRSYCIRNAFVDGSYCVQDVHNAFEMFVLDSYSLFFSREWKNLLMALGQL